MVFINHCGARPITTDELRDLPEPIKMSRPEWDGKFHGDHTPVRHDKFVDLTKRTLARAGYDITHEEYSLVQKNAIDKKLNAPIIMPDGVIKPAKDTLFGLLHVTHQKKVGGERLDVTNLVGIRNGNAMDSVCLLGCGERVFVCDNMCFSADFVVARKHTSGVHVDLPERMSGAVAKLKDEFARADVRREVYKQYRLDDEAIQSARDLEDSLTMSVADIMCAMMKPEIRLNEDGEPLTDKDGKPKWENDKHITPGSTLGAWAKEYRNPSHEEFNAENVWCLKNAYTEVIKGWAPASIQRRTVKLTRVLDRATGFEQKYENWRAN